MLIDMLRSVMLHPITTRSLFSLFWLLQSLKLPIFCTF